MFQPSPTDLLVSTVPLSPYSFSPLLSSPGAQLAISHFFVLFISLLHLVCLLIVRNGLPLPRMRRVGLLSLSQISSLVVLARAAEVVYVTDLQIFTYLVSRLLEHTRGVVERLMPDAGTMRGIRRGRQHPVPDK